MFFNKYSNYNTEDVVKPYFKEVCENLLKIVKDDESKRKVTGILYEGGFDDFTVNVEGVRNTPTLEQSKRLEMAYLLATNPETFNQIQKDNAIIFHGTTSKALEGIAKHGLCNRIEIENKGEQVKSGEEWSKNKTNEDIVSCTNSLNLASYYACKNVNETDFEAIICIQKDSIDTIQHLWKAMSDLPEIMFTKSIPLELISSICVPKDKVKEVSELFKDKGIAINSIDVHNPIYNLDIAYPEFAECNDYLNKLYKNKMSIEKNDNFQLHSLGNHKKLDDANLKTADSFNNFDNPIASNALQLYKKDNKFLSFFKNIINRFKNKKSDSKNFTKTENYNVNNIKDNSITQTEVKVSDEAFLNDINKINNPSEIKYNSSHSLEIQKDDKNIKATYNSR